MPDTASLDAVVARLRSSNWTDANELANALAVGLSSVARQQTFNRGVHDKSIVNRDGGTSLAVGDNSVARQSTSLQPPQRGFLIKHGAIASRRQARVETESRALAGIVFELIGAGSDTSLNVAIVGDVPVVNVDPTTRQNVGGDMNEKLVQNPEDLASDGQTSTVIVPLVGNPFAGGDSDDHGTAIPKIGQSVQVVLSKAYEKTTVWSERSRRHYPRVSEKAISNSAVVTNGFCCKEPGGGGSDPGS